MAAAALVAVASWGAAAQPPAAHKSHLPNGLRLIVQANEHTATVVLSGFVRVTALHELRATTGMRQLTQMLIARGDGFGELMGEAAVHADVSVAPDYVELVLAAPAQSLADCAHLMRGMLFDPELTGQALELTRAQLIRQLAAREEVPVSLALDRLLARVYPGVGAGDFTAADVAEVAAIGLEDVRRFHAAHYLPNATVITVSGGVDEASATRIVRRAMQGLLPGAMPEEAPTPLAVAPPDTENRSIAGSTSVYAVGARAVALDSPQYPAAAVGMSMLGSGMDSRLYRALRVDRALAYTIGAEMTPSAAVPSAFVVVTCDPDGLGEVERVVDAEIERTMGEPAGVEELRRAKRYLIGRQALRRQRNREIAHWLGVFELLGGPQGYRRDAQLAGDIAAVDAGSVADAMRDVFETSWAVRLDASDAAAR
ncbi:MAG: pitrilysin family protein [Armatimonadota bacterium]|nr:pitrilysin family protein [Armatimonadota bacterium]